MQKFLEVRNNTAHGEDFPNSICRELIDISKINHVYIELPEEKAICIEWISRKGYHMDKVEEFDSKAACYTRFNEISRILCGD